jgi:hypothetical protein
VLSGYGLTQGCEDALNPYHLVQHHTRAHRLSLSLSLRGLVYIPNARTS